MSDKPNNPDELILIDRQFSFRTTWSVCRWWFIAFIISMLCDVIFANEKKQWPLPGRVIIVVVEFLALLFFMLDVARWIRGTDELQRRITLAALLFAVSASFFSFLFWLRLEREGFFNAIFGAPIWNNTWGISSVAHACALLSTFYGVGYLIFKRRYK
jgi:hypothetical protein